MAGKGSGRKQLHLILEAIENGTYKDMATMRQWADSLEDERTGLTLSPMHYIYRYQPTYVAFEQVPAVLPVWQAMGVELERLGYSVWVGYLHSEQYGVPQTRKRAYLMARRDGVPVVPPVPSHSKYHSRTPGKLDPGVERWVDMETALASIEGITI